MWGSNFIEYSFTVFFVRHRDLINLSSKGQSNLVLSKCPRKLVNNAKHFQCLDSKYSITALLRTGCGGLGSGSGSWGVGEWGHHLQGLEGLRSPCILLCGHIGN